jgi:DNA-binding CsgD family transcriptional regulator
MSRIGSIATRGWEKPEAAPSLRADVAALICPDWRVPSLVLDAGSRQVVYANTPCLQLLAERSSLQIAAGRLAFVSPILDAKFYATLRRMVASGAESAAMVEREAPGDNFISVIIHNALGFFREVLDRSIGGRDEGDPLVVVEIASSRDQSDWSAMRAFTQTFDLTPLEGEIAELVVHGLTPREIATLKGRLIGDILDGLKSVLAKTRCKHQAQLVRLVMTLCPPTRRA